MAKSNKCQNCGGFLIYSPQDSALKCQNCGALKQINVSDKIKQHDYESTKTMYDNSWAKDKRQVKCQNCGANILIDSFSLLDKCTYCGGTTLVDVENAPSIKPDAVLPFAIDRKQAKEHFKNGLKGKMFIPSVLKKKLPNLKITPRYINSYVFNAELVATYSGRLTYTETETDKDGHIHTHTYTKFVSGVMPHKVVDCVIESSTNLSQTELLKIMPYDLSKLKSYSGDFLFGSSAEYSDKPLETAYREMESMATNAIKNNIVRKHHADGVDFLNMEFEYLSKKYCYCLLPTYIFDYDYKNKHYKTLMNGTTGKLGGGVPRSGTKVLWFVLAWVLGILGIGLLISLFI